MTLERWEEIKTNVKRQSPDAEEGREDLLVDTADGQVKQGEAEYLIFQSPLGRTKLQLQMKPRLEEKKFFFSHRQGDSARVEYKFSEHDLIYTLKAYRWNELDESWQEFDSDAFSGS